MKTYNYIVKTNGEIISKHTGKPLSPHKDKKGYLRVRLKHKDGGVTHLVHRVVATCHIPNPNNLPQVNHKDGDKSNNSIENLEWCSGRGNVDHSVEQGLVKRGIDRPNAKFSDEDVTKIRQERVEGKTYYELADKWGAAYQTIHKICSRQTYTHVV